MQAQYEFSFDITKDDVIEFSKALMPLEPAWAEAQKKHERSMRLQALCCAPFIIGGTSLLIAQGSSTQGMHLEGAGIGVVFAAFLYFALPRLNEIQKSQKNRIEQISEMDLSAYMGKRTVTMDENGVFLQSPEAESRISWRLVTPTIVSTFFVLYDESEPISYLPSRCFASTSTRDELLEQAKQWHQAAQLPHALRLERYLADRDLPCPKCKYNLRGMNGEICPECGVSIQLETLVGQRAEVKSVNK